MKLLITLNSFLYIAYIYQIITSYPIKMYNFYGQTDKYWIKKKCHWFNYSSSRSCQGTKQKSGFMQKRTIGVK
jgi:hypothetical protein